jgi:hypothetical protein
MRWVFSLALLILGSTVLRAEGAKTKSSPTESAGSSKQKSTSGKPAKSAHGTHSRGRRAKHSAAPNYQLHPDSSRYAEIQKALADRGYFKGDANGQWNDESVDALKRFQTDQNLDNDGKINSLTLIGLGLGPKHDSLPVSPNKPPSSAPVSGGSPSPSTEEAAPAPTKPPM